MKGVNKMYQKILKRIFDIVIALPLLILLIPFFIVISLMIKIEDHGPVFYNALRLGKNGVI
ncbi:sugar transferase, partial [Enterococcus faecium]|nr:sugar transferase [Enterococcus faecium]